MKMTVLETCVRCECGHMEDEHDRDGVCSHPDCACLELCS